MIARDWRGHEPQAFGELLRRCRLAAGLTQQALAERSRLSVRAITDLERGVRRFPYSETVERLTQGLRLDEHERDALQRARRKTAAPRRNRTSGARADGLPTGIVTFLFADVEDGGSTADHQPGAIRTALARREALVDGLVERHHGFRVSTRLERNMVLAVFVRASDALAAAYAIQQALVHETELRRVRVALHTLVRPNSKATSIAGQL